MSDFKICGEDCKAKDRMIVELTNQLHEMDVALKEANDLIKKIQEEPNPESNETRRG